MKTSINPVFILYSSLRKKPAALPGPCADKTFDNRKMATITRQLIYESTVDDVFWVLHTKIRGKTVGVFILTIMPGPRATKDENG